jgi:uncharacterized protein
MIRIARGSCMLIGSFLVGCSSSSPRFYTLVPEPVSGAPSQLTAAYRLEVEPVKVPAQIDRLELVTRLPGGGVAIADGDRWIAPVADELQSALSVELRQRLGAVDPATACGDSLLVRLNIERFESSPNQYALIEASWHLELRQGGKVTRLSCRTQAYEQVRGGYPDVVRGYQRAVVLIADQIAMVALGSPGAVAAECPLNPAPLATILNHP